MVKVFVAAALAVMFAVSPVHAQTQPADSMIKTAVQDLDRFEKEAEGLTPKHKANIVRIQRRIPMAEQRLRASKNQSHPSWIEASDRLNALKERLAALAAGKTPEAAKPAAPTAATAPTTAPPAGMTDNQIIAKYNDGYRALSNDMKGTPFEKLADQSVVDGFKAKLADLKNLVESLQNPSNRRSYEDHYQKVEANFDKRLAQAQARVAQQQPAPAPSQPEPQPAAQQPAPAAASAELDFQNKRNLGFFQKDYDRYVKEFDQITPANTPTLTGYIERLEKPAVQIDRDGSSGRGGGPREGRGPQNQVRHGPAVATEPGRPSG